ncbi:hypothetical protein Msub_21002, partial [Marinobacter subterrani]
MIDEAAFVDDIEELLKAAMAMTIWAARSASSAPTTARTTRSNTLINDIRAGRYDYSLHRVDLDNALADGLYRRICQVTGQTWTREAEVQWRQQLINRYKPNEDEELLHSGPGWRSYLTRVQVEACMADAPVLRLTVPASSTPCRNLPAGTPWRLDPRAPGARAAHPGPAARHALGQDFARSGDLSVIAPWRSAPPCTARCRSWWRCTTCRSSSRNRCCSPLQRPAQAVRRGHRQPG